MPTRPCNRELRGLSGSEPCGACNQPARDHRGHREYVEPEHWTVEYKIGDSGWISHGLGVYTTRGDAEEALKSCSISDDKIRIARCDASGRIVSSTGAVVETFEPVTTVGIDLATTPDRPTVIAGAKREGAEWMRDAIRSMSSKSYRETAWTTEIQLPSDWPAPPNPLTKIASALGCDADEAACLDAIDSLRRELECSEDASSMERQRRKDVEQERDAAVDLASHRGEQVSRLTAELAKALAALEVASEKFQPELAESQSDDWPHRVAHVMTSRVVSEYEYRAMKRQIDAMYRALEGSKRRIAVAAVCELLVEHGRRRAPARGFPDALREQIAAWVALRSGCRFSRDLIRDVHAWLTSQPVDETESLRAELAASREHANLLASSLLMIASEAAGDPKFDHRDYRDPRYTPALRHVGELRREAESLRARVDELEGDIERRKAGFDALHKNRDNLAAQIQGLRSHYGSASEVTRLEKERDEAMADMMLAREDLAGCEYDLAKLIRAVYDGRGFEDAANDAEMNGRDGWLDVALDIAAPGPARRMRSERDSARAKAIEEACAAAADCPLPKLDRHALASYRNIDHIQSAIRALANKGER